MKKDTDTKLKLIKISKTLDQKLNIIKTTTGSRSIGATLDFLVSFYAYKAKVDFSILDRETSFKKEN